jgi:hypothetical protein
MAVEGERGGRKLLRETARAHEIVIHPGSINRGRVHMLLSIPPSLSVDRAGAILEGVQLGGGPTRLSAVI